MAETAYQRLFLAPKAYQEKNNLRVTIHDENGPSGPAQVISSLRDTHCHIWTRGYCQCSRQGIMSKDDFF
jgi:hypothetical protein